MNRTRLVFWVHSWRERVSLLLTSTSTRRISTLTLDSVQIKTNLPRNQALSPLGRGLAPYKPVVFAHAKPGSA
jgi:hypothetical protein